MGEFVYFDVINQTIYYNPIKGTFSIPTINNDPKFKLIANHRLYLYKCVKKIN